jgi:hypothetical protein
MLIYSSLSAYFDDVIPQQPALSNDGKQRQPALGDFTSPIPSSGGSSLEFWDSSESEPFCQKKRITQAMTRVRA